MVIFAKRHTKANTIFKYHNENHEKNQISTNKDIQLFKNVG